MKSLFLRRIVPAVLLATLLLGCEKEKKSEPVYFLDKDGKVVQEKKLKEAIKKRLDKVTSPGFGGWYVYAFGASDSKLEVRWVLQSIWKDGTGFSFYVSGEKLDSLLTTEERDELSRYAKNKLTVLVTQHKEEELNRERIKASKFAKRLLEEK